MGEAEDAVPGVAGARKGLNPFLLGLAFFLAWPLGLFLLLIHPRYGRSRAWWWIGGFWSLMCFVSWMGKGSPPDAPDRPVADQPPPVAVQPAPPPVQEPPVSAVRTPPVAATSTSAGEGASKGVKSYEVSKGWGRGSIRVELPADRELGIDLSDLELTGAGRLKYTIVWHGFLEDGRFRVGKIKDMRWAAFDRKGVKLSDGDLDFGRSIRRGEPTKGEMILGYDEWKQTTRIEIR